MNADFWLSCSLVAALSLWVGEHRRQLSLLSSLLLVTVPWMQISLAVQDKITVSSLALLAVVATGLFLHVVYLAINTGLVKLFRLGGCDPKDGELSEMKV